MAKQQNETFILIPFNAIQLPIELSLYLKIEKYCQQILGHDFQSTAIHTIQQLINKTLEQIVMAEKSEKKDYLDIKDG